MKLVCQPGFELVAVVDEDDLADGSYGPGGGVYFIRCEQFVKIGMGWSILARFANLQNASPFRLEGLAFIPCASESDALRLEQALHQRFAESRVRGEWFSDTAALRSHLASSAVPWPPPR